MYAAEPHEYFTNLGGTEVGQIFENTVLPFNMQRLDGPKQGPMWVHKTHVDSSGILPTPLKNHESEKLSLLLQNQDGIHIVPLQSKV